MPALYDLVIKGVVMQEVVFTLTIDDLIALSAQQTKNVARKVRRSLPKILSLLFMLMFLADFLKNGGFVEALLKSLVFSLFIEVLVEGGLFIELKITGREVRRYLIKQGQNAAMILCEQRLTLSPEAIERSTEYESFSSSWKIVEKIEEMQTHAFFVLTQPSFSFNFLIANSKTIILPCHAFAEEKKFQEFVEAAKRYHREAIRHQEGSIL